MGLATPGIAWSQCATSMTAANELVIRTGAGPCDAASLRQGVTHAVSTANAAEAGAGASTARTGALADIRLSPAQSALWRLGQINTKPQNTTIVMPGMAGKP